MPFANIVCAIDFSETSSKALESAVELARTFGAGLTLLYVYQPPTYALPDASLVLPSPEMLNAALRDVDNELATWKKRAEERGAAKVAVASEQGTPWQVIVEWAKQHGADLIVLGTHGRTGFSRLMLGSVAERVVRGATCPVLTVHPGPVAG